MEVRSPLLPRFCTALEDWDAGVQEGYAALTALQRQLSQLRLEDAGTDRHEKPSDIHVKLLAMAPSFRLEQHIARQSPTQLPDPSHAAKLQAGYFKLQSSISDAQEASARLTRLARKQMDQTLSAELALGADCSGSPDDTDTAPVCTETPQTLAPAPEELALLMTSVASGIAKDAAWMALLAPAITIATAADDLEAYVTMWELQPFTDEDAVAALLALE